MESPSPYPAKLSSSSSSASPIINLLLRIFTFILLLISLIILTTTTATLSLTIGEVEFKFNDVYAFRYMLFTIIIGIVYALLQLAFAINLISTGKRLIRGNGLYHFDFYGDKLITYTLATGAAAAFGASIDLKSTLTGLGSGVDSFFGKADASASLLLIAFVCSAISSVFSSLALSKID